MKKIFSIIFILIMAVGFNTAAFADTTQDETNQQIKSEIAALKTEFLNNRSEILSLKSEIASTGAEINTKLQELKSSDADISQEELDQIKSSLSTIKADRKALSAINVDQLQPLIQRYKEAIISRDFASAKPCLENMIAIQDDKLEALQQIKTDMDVLLAIL